MKKLIPAAAGLVSAVLTLIMAVPALGAGVVVDGARLGCEAVNLDGSLYIPADCGLFTAPAGLVEEGGVIYAPLRLNCESLGWTVRWNDETGDAAVMTGVPAIEALRSTEGYAMLDEDARQRFDSFVFGSRAFKSGVYDAAAALLEANGYLQKSPDEQEALLAECLRLAPFVMVDFGGVPDLCGGVEAEIGAKTYLPSYNVWRGDLKPVWRYEASMSDGYKTDIFTTVEDNPVVEISARALTRFPLAVRQYLKRLIYIEDGVNSYNGSGDTVWIRLDHEPDEDSVARTLAHELGHVLDKSLTSDDSVWEAAQAADGVAVSTYGSSSRDEDLAEFSRLYFMTATDSAASEAVARAYPNRSAAFRALLYAADGEYYKDFRADFDSLSPFEAAEPVYSVIMPKNSRMALTVQSADSAAGSVLVLAKNEGKDTQLWWIRRRTDGGAALVNKATGYCASVSGGSLADGRPLVTWDGPARLNETWNIEEKDGCLVFRARHSGFCMGFNDAAVVQSAAETLWTAEAAQ